MHQARFDRHIRSLATTPRRRVLMALAVALGIALAPADGDNAVADKRDIRPRGCPPGKKFCCIYDEEGAPLCLCWTHVCDPP